MLQGSSGFLEVRTLWKGTAIANQSSSRSSSSSTFRTFVALYFTVTRGAFYESFLAYNDRKTRLHAHTMDWTRIELRPATGKFVLVVLIFTLLLFTVRLWLSPINAVPLRVAQQSEGKRHCLDRISYHVNRKVKGK